MQLHHYEHKTNLFESLKDLSLHVQASLTVPWCCIFSCTSHLRRRPYWTALFYFSNGLKCVVVNVTKDTTVRYMLFYFVFKITKDTAVIYVYFMLYSKSLKIVCNIY